MHRKQNKLNKPWQILGEKRTANQLPFTPVPMLGEKRTTNQLPFTPAPTWNLFSGRFRFSCRTRRLFSRFTFRHSETRCEHMSWYFNKFTLRLSILITAFIFLNFTL